MLQETTAPEEDQEEDASTSCKLAAQDIHVDAAIVAVFSKPIFHFEE